MVYGVPAGLPGAGTAISLWQYLAVVIDLRAILRRVAAIVAPEASSGRDVTNVVRVSTPT